MPTPAPPGPVPAALPMPSPAPPPPPPPPAWANATLEPESTVANANVISFFMDLLIVALLLKTIPFVDTARRRMGRPTRRTCIVFLASSVPLAVKRMRAIRGNTRCGTPPGSSHPESPRPEDYVRMKSRSFRFESRASSTPCITRPPRRRRDCRATLPGAAHG
ncbi:hypothetical protein CY652_08870 [Burkholderia sp. WAC0059]|nr:hypothetical protein CY652_08870 [Burkholderia sp. WAC0059]